MSLMLSFNTLSGYEDHASADYENRTDQIEECGTHAACGWELSTCIIYYGNLVFSTIRIHG